MFNEKVQHTEKICIRYVDDVKNVPFFIECLTKTNNLENM